MADERSPWAAHRRRAQTLRERHRFAAQVLGLYVGLVDVWAYTWDQLEHDKPEPDQVAEWAVRHVLPGVAAATLAAGPPPLAEATRQLIADGGLESAMAAWLAGKDMPPVERYLARACLNAPLQAVDAAAACSADPAPRDARHCPRCGGLPQLSVRSAADDPLVSGPRRLVCARCADSWSYSRSACPFCGETQGSQRTVYAEEAATPRFPHLRLETCATCSHYLIDIDLGRDGQAVPDVDELAALPLDLYAADNGLTKITPNLMGF